MTSIKFTTHNDGSIPTVGTHGLGSLDCSYSKLVETFGEPLPGDYKTDAEWEIEFSDGLVATIYNWKNGKNYCGNRAPAVEEITCWHVGGRKMQVETRLNLLLNKIPLGDDRWIDAK